jgi:2-keto-4-pentenoate hydratase
MVRGRAERRPGCGALLRLAATAGVLAAGTAAHAERCPPSPDPRVAGVAAAWLERRQHAPLTMSQQAASCFRDDLLTRLRAQVGRPIGYKVGVYTREAQRSYNASGPVVGVLTAGMMIPAGRPVSVRYAYAPVVEADFLLVVKDAGINRARTRDELFRHLRGFRAFFELPDNGLPKPFDAAQLVALDVNARAGMMGPEIKLLPGADGVKALAGLTAEITVDGPHGRKQFRAASSTALGDPLEIALFARDALASEGKALKAGDLISIGTITPPYVPQAGEAVRAVYRVGSQMTELGIRFIP